MRGASLRGVSMTGTSTRSALRTCRIALVTGLVLLTACAHKAPTLY